MCVREGERKWEEKRALEKIARHNRTEKLRMKEKAKFG